MKFFRIRVEPNTSFAGVDFSPRRGKPAIWPPTHRLTDAPTHRRTDTPTHRMDQALDEALDWYRRNVV